MKIFAGAENMLTIVVIACVLVLFAMVLDLISGLYKAKLRGEFRSSWGLKRTLQKFIMYQGGMLIAAGVDILIHLSNMYVLFGLRSIYGLPIVTCMLAIFLLVVEFLSIREAADEKTKKEQDSLAKALAQLLDKKTIGDILSTALDKQKEALDRAEVQHA